MTAQIIDFPTNHHPLEISLNRHLRFKRSFFAARFMPAQDHTVDDEIQIIHGGVPTGITVQLNTSGEFPEYCSIMEHGESNGRPWLRQHGEYRRNDELEMASFFSRLWTVLERAALIN
jgi:hypothetical protein